MVFPALYALIVGLAMFGQWAFLLATGRVPELKTEPYRIGFHLAAEGLTAIALLVAGIGLLSSASWGGPLHLVAVGMLLYTSVVSPGYFAQQRQWPMVAMFGLILVLAVLSLWWVL
jgi:hypothetical protein